MRRRIDDVNFNGDILSLDQSFAGDNAAILKAGGGPSTVTAGVRSLTNTLTTIKSAVGPVMRNVITFAAQTVSFLRTSSSVASAGLEIFDFPEGWIRMHSCVVQGLTVGLTATDSINFVGSVGTAAAAANATLTSTEADWVASTSLTLTSNVATFNGAPIASANFDGTATAKKLFINFASSGDIVSTRNITLTGSLVILWSLLGDY